MAANRPSVPDQASRSPLWHGLLVRLLVASSAVALVSVATTAWLAAQSTSRSIREEIGAALAADSRTYQALLGYAVSHQSWDGAGPAVRDLAASTGRRIVLTTENRRVIADSGGSGEIQTPARPSAVVDPLAVDPTLAPGGGADRIDARVAGPYRLSPDERARLASAARTFTGCAPGPANAPLRVSATGRAIVDTAGAPPGPSTSACSLAHRALTTSTPTEQAALRQLNDLVDACLARRNMPPVRLDFDRSWRPRLAPPAEAGTPAAATAPAAAAAATGCLAAGRRDQLRPFVPPPALLFLTDRAGKDSTAPGSLSSVKTSRIVLVAVVIVVLTVGVSVFLSVLLIRPLRALTSAARRIRHGELGARVAVGSKGEIGELAQAFNEMAEHRERTERQRKALVSDISHELRTPLGTMRSWLEAAKDGVIELDGTRLSSLLDEAIVLQHLIDDLQDLALVEAGKLRLHPEAVDVGELLDQVAGAHADQAGAAAVMLRTEISDGEQVTADPVRLRQIVANLVTNAVRHTPGGGAVRLAARPAGDEWVEIEVSDTGIGIDAADLPHVFDRFWRADPSRTRLTGGSGLGLAIVHGLVTAHGGTVAVTSEPGRGTTFTVRLPSSQVSVPVDRIEP